MQLKPSSFKGCEHTSQWQLNQMIQKTAVALVFNQHNGTEYIYLHLIPATEIKFKPLMSSYAVISETALT